MTCIYLFLGLIVVKPYTVVNTLNNEKSSPSEPIIELLIKHYSDGAMTTILKDLHIGIDMKEFIINFFLFITCFLQ